MPGTTDNQQQSKSTNAWLKFARYWQTTRMNYSIGSRVCQGVVSCIFVHIIRDVVENHFFACLSQGKKEFQNGTPKPSYTLLHTDSCPNPHSERTIHVWKKTSTQKFSPKSSAKHCVEWKLPERPSIANSSGMSFKWTATVEKVV